MQQNRMNAVLACGHSSGEVTMWTPNMGSSPVVKLLAHPSASVTSVSVSKNGYYMATTGKDSRLKIWDIRSTYKCMYDYFTSAPATTTDWSDTGLLAVGYGNQVQLWKNTQTEKQKEPYMKHRMPGQSSTQIQQLKFLPFEDVLGIGHSNGYSSISVPGSGEANYDAYEANPFETKK